MTVKQLKRMIERDNEKLKLLKDDEGNLSNWGYWAMGYWQGRLSVLESLLDTMEDNDE